MGISAIWAAAWAQWWTHLLALLVTVIFYVGETNKVETALMQGFAHLLLIVMTLAAIDQFGEKKEQWDRVAQRREASSQYWHACLWALFQHTDYFIIFVCRNAFSSADAENVEPIRAMENEVETLNQLFLQPMGFNQSSDSLAQEFSHIIKSFSQDTDSQGYNTELLLNNGKLLFWYQIYEGTIHGLIIVGSLFFLLGFRRGMWAERIIFWCYEVGMVLEIITYGPAYFWVISVMFVGAFAPSALGLSATPGASVKALATVFTVHHHVGYALDTWGCFQIAQAWGLTPAKRQERAAESAKKRA